MSIAVTDEIEPESIDIDPRPCELCGWTIEDLEAVIFLRTAELIEQWELADPRDRWKWTGEATPIASCPAEIRPRPYKTPEATEHAFWHVVRNESSEYVARWLAQHPLDAPFLLKIWKQKNAHGKPLSPEEVLGAFAQAGFLPIKGNEDPRQDVPPHVEIPPNADGEPIFRPLNGATAAAVGKPAAPMFDPITPVACKGTEPVKQRWLASTRIPSGDLTILTGDGGSGKTEIATGLLVSVAADLGDWLGCVVESGLGLLISCEEPEENIRDRVERICKHRSVDPHAIEDLHLYFPDLDATWLGSADRAGRIEKTPLLLQIEKWIEQHQPRLVVIDSIAAVFDGEAIARRQVRAFLAMLRKLAREHDTAIVLLDHPSVRGMADGTGTANSVDWRNSVRSMLHLSGPDRDDPDTRELELKKSNRGRVGEKTKLRWNGLTFTTEATAAASPYRAAAERDIEELFLKLLDKRIVQKRPVRPSTGRGSAPAELADDPEANGTTAEAFRAAMERLYTAGKIVTVETGPVSKRTKHIERAPGT